MQKRGLFPQDRGADVARRADMARGTHVDATRHARPRGRAAQAHAALRWRKVARTSGRGHASPHGRPRGAPRCE